MIMKRTAVMPSTLCDYWMYKRLRILRYWPQKSFVTSALLALFVTAATASDTGPATYYTPGGIIGTCGVAIQNSDFSVALDNTQFGTGGLCGRSVQVSYGGQSAIVTVADKRPTCVGGIGLTPAAFEYFAPLSSGWFEATWEFV